MSDRRRAMRRGFTIRDLVVAMTCLMVAATLVLSVTGATRSLSQAQVCADHLRQLYAGMASYVEQYKVYPPHNPYPQYMGNRWVNGIYTNGWDPNIGFIMTHGLGLVPPETESMTTGHFIWYGTPFADLPDVCKCPAMPPELLDPTNPELDSNPYGQMETLVYQYALSYQAAGTARAATTLLTYPLGATSGQGGRNPPIPDPTSGQGSGQQASNAQGGTPGIWVFQKPPGSDPADPGTSAYEYVTWIQAVQPAEVQQPSRVYYLADSRDYRPTPGGWPVAGKNNGWYAAYGNKVFLGTRHFEYANALYLDGRVSRGNQTHMPQWNMEYDPAGNGQSVHWRCSTFATNIRLANICTQVHLMPVLMVKGWEYFFETNGLVAK